MTDVDYELVEAYSKISPKYTKLKRMPWKDFQQYLFMMRQKYTLLTSGILLDIGAGNCRNLLLFEDQKWENFASDVSFELLNKAISLENNIIYPMNNDMKVLSLREDCVDFAICIATLHHLRNSKDVVKVLENIQYTLKKNKFLIISCWRRWKKGSRKEMIKDLLLYPYKKLRNSSWRHGDIYLSWFGNNKEVIARRYYHLFTRRELVRIIRKSGFDIVNLTKLGGVKGNDNFFLLLKSKDK